ncbi:Neutral amino acid transporter B(0) [Phytophthora cinnamomi]|uniref:Neutral amino acid transporter B(0) n=1 Tax=Phytophthora cinnamomi TaxID=4785 RepID=UPI0035594609|nr:Neutral amino acid transporter B(0) [Phytophthora cinnamomi]
MSGRSTSSRRDSESESEISIAPSSIDSISGLRRSKPRHVIYEDSEAEEGESRHSELDLSLYDTDEIQDSERPSYRISLGSDGFESILSDPSGSFESADEEITFPASRNRATFNSFVSVDAAGSQARGPPLHLQQLEQQSQQLRHLQRQQHEQIREQQERFPRAYEAASISSTSFYKYLRDAFAGGGAYGGDTGSHRGGETDSSRSRGFHATASYARSSRAPMGSETNAQSNLSNASSRDAPLGTPNDSYDVLGTPPGEPPAVRPSRQPSRTHSEQTRDFTPFDEIYSQALQHLPRSMNSYLLAVLMAAGFGIGFAALSADPPAAYGYWLNQIGTLYIRLVNCAAVPMGICQVIFSVSTLTARGALQRLWLKTLGFHFVLSLLSVLMAVIIAAALRHSLKQTDVLIFEASSTRFGFQCSNSKYLELNGTSLACDSDTFDDANSTAAVFPSFVDVNGVLGLPETITKLTLTQWVYLLGERYVPNNVVQALSADYYISSMMIATVLGVAVTRSFRGGGVGRERGDARCNPLLRLFVHLYAALFTILDWLQSVALVAILPLIIGSVLIDPVNAKLASFAGKWCLASVLVCAIQSLVLCPILFFMVTRRQPFGWLLKMMPALLYSVLLQSPLLPLAIATKSVLRSREVPPAVFGALYPVLAACNRLAQAIVLPVVLMWVVSYTDCSLPLDFSNSALLFGYSMVGSLGDTAMPQSIIVFFYMVWNGFCGSSDLPPTPIELGGVLLLITRLQALTNTATNLMLVRMAASTEEGRMYAHHFAM